MRLLGIDYGKKRIGLALSDELGEFASPYSVLENDFKIPIKIKEVCEKEGVGMIVLGESVNLKGDKNPIMKEIEKFKTLLEENLGLPVEFEKEHFTSSEAERILGKDKMLDARAAAIILRNYIDKKKFS